MMITQDRAFTPVASCSCCECGTIVFMDFIPWEDQDYALCADCEAYMTDAFFEQCWAFVDRITPPPVEE